MDTLDPEGKKLMAHALPDPAEGSPAYPRLQIENRVYQSYCFRKLHLEVAVRQDGLQVLHCVMFPRIKFDLPILSLDLVGFKGRPSLAIIDPCPVHLDQSLPQLYSNSVQSLQKKYNVETNRSIPDWGKDIFSPLCVCIRPSGSEDVGRFMKYALALCDFHIQFARLCSPVQQGSRMSVSQIEQRSREIYECHYRFNQRQMENDKTRRVLEAAFGSEAAREYMSKIMFDTEPFHS